MARYIDVDKFAEKICNFQAIDEDAANAMIWLLRTFPTADVVEVVRIIKELAEENERLRVVADMSDTTLTDALRIVNEFCDKRVKRAIADTVRKMQEQLKVQKFTHKNFGELVYVEDIDQIAKEMLEGDTE